ncbi:hypothetical protein RI129_004420 [Pyrocoelia pectoralis]|uniref:Uncharacterized protein n=1 Tax=Pyrocoelia pectoralis TaxID=417401 RepID=A0AAN7VI80_9COLE
MHSYDTKKVMVLLPIIVASTMVFISESKHIPPDIAEHWKQTLAPFHTICLNETELNPQLLAHLLSDFEIPDEKLIHCYWKCMQEHMEIIKNGKINIDAMYKAIYMITPYMRTICVEEAYKEEELCRRSHKLAQCIISNKME